MERKMKYLLTTLVILTLGFVQSQVLIGGGASLQNGLNTGFTGYGLNANVEIPSSTTSTFMIRLKYLNFNETMDIEGYENAQPVVGEELISTKSRDKNNLFDLTVGRRAYFFNDYDIGFSAYGGIYIGLSFAPTSRKIVGYDEFYSQDEFGFRYDETTEPFTYFYLKTEFNGGFCYNLPLGNAIFLDASLDYILLSNAATSPNFNTNRIGQFNVGVNIGYRHTIF